jgi:hypothetical protein
MMHIVKRLLLFMIGVAMSGLLTSSAVAGGGLSQVSASVSAYGVTNTTQAGAVVETFDGLSTGTDITGNTTTAVGTLKPGVSSGVGSSAGDFAIVNGTSPTYAEYAGAAGSTNYFALGSESSSAGSVTLHLSGPASYVGLWWAAIDGNNSLVLLDNGQVVGAFNTSGTGSIDGVNYTSVYSSSLLGTGGAWDGNPNPLKPTLTDSSQAFAYFNFTAAAGTVITDVVITNSSDGTGFEADNLSAVFASKPSSAVLGASAFIFAGMTWLRREVRADRAAKVAARGSSRIH